ncbi:hypothetical protein D9M68_710810 [compost metagenome]
MFDLADLFDHAGAEHRVLVDEADTHQIIAGLLVAPGHHAGIARGVAEQGDVHLDRGSAAEAARPIARHAAEADMVHALAREAGLLANQKLHRQIARMKQELMHDGALRLHMFLLSIMS